MTYNRCKLLKECLNTLVTQKYPRDKLEIIVIDDGSTDETQKVVLEFISKNTSVKYVYQSNKGISSARNQGIKNTTGDLIAFVADDYLFPNNYAETIDRFFSEKPIAKAVRFRLKASDNNFISRVCHFHYEVDVRKYLSRANLQGSRNWKEQLVKLLQRIPHNNSHLSSVNTLPASGAAAYRRELFNIVGIFDERLKHCEDVDFAWRMREHNIPIFYYSNLSITRRYGPTILSEFKKSFMGGFYEYLYQEVNSVYSVVLYGTKNSSLHRKILTQIIKLGLKPIWRARQAESIKIFLLYLPIFYFLELGYSIGVLWKIINFEKTNNIK